MVRHDNVMAAQRVHARAVMQRELGFSLSLKRSGIDRNGLGVFMAHAVAESKLVGLYPGEWVGMYWWVYTLGTFSKLHDLY